MVLYLSAEAREGRLVTSVERGRGTLTALAALTTSTTTAEIATATATTLTTSTSTTSLATTLATTFTTGTATGTTTATSTTGTIRLDIALVNVDELLGLALTFALSLATRARNELIVLLLSELFGAGPLLVGLGALVRLANVEGSVKGKLLLGQLSKVFGVGNALVLRLELSSGSFGVLSSGILQLGLSDLLANLLVFLLSIAISSTPGLGCLLLGVSTVETLAWNTSGERG